MRTTIQSLIEEYFALTERPIATMTVSEFLAFKQAAAASFTSSDVNDPLVGWQDTSVSKTLDQNTSDNYSGNKKKNIPGVKESTDEKYNIPTDEFNVIPMQEEKKNNEHALAMLRSING